MFQMTPLRKLAHAIYRKKFRCKNDNFHWKIFDIFAQNIDCGYTLEPPLPHVRTSEAVLTSTHNLCFGAKIRKIDIPCIPQFFYIKVGFKGVFIARTCFPDDSESSE